MNDLVNEIWEKGRLLETALLEAKKRGLDFADKERCYKIALARKMLEERAKGTPVSIISDICKGDEVIANVRYERDAAEIVYENAREAINTYKMQLRMLNDQLSREWEGAG